MQKKKREFVLVFVLCVEALWRHWPGIFYLFIWIPIRVRAADHLGVSIKNTHQHVSEQR